MKKMLLVLAIVGMFVMPMMPATKALTTGFDGKDDDGSFMTLHDVNLNGHMELWSYYHYPGNPGGHAWCLVYNEVYLEGGKDTKFSISGHIYGELESPTLEDVAEIQIRLQVYKDTYWRGHPWKEWIVYDRTTTGVINTNVFASKDVLGSEITTGYYYVAFVANIVASGKSTWYESLADFHTGSYCVEAYSATAQQQEEPKPDLWWANPSWKPNPPEKNKDITFSIDVYKSGEINCNFNVQLYLDGNPKRYKTVSPYDFVNNIAHISLTFQWPNDRKEHTVKIVIDSHNDIDESDESNNVWVKSLYAATNDNSNNNIRNLPDLYTIAFQMHATSQSTQQFYAQTNEIIRNEMTPTNSANMSVNSGNSNKNT